MDTDAVEFIKMAKSIQNVLPEVIVSPAGPDV